MTAREPESVPGLCLSYTELICEESPGVGPTLWMLHAETMAASPSHGDGEIVSAAVPRSAL